jgi:serine/threonine protein kinase
MKLYQLKCIRKDIVLEAKKVGAFRIEKEILTTLKHPFFVKIEHSYQDEKRIYFLKRFIK